MKRWSRTGWACLLALTALLPGCMGGDENGGVSGNRNPEIATMTAAPSSVTVGGSVVVTVSATDPDGDELEYAYSADGGEVTGTGPSVTWTAPGAAGEYHVTVTVSDGKGGSAGGTIAVLVAEAASGITGVVRAAPGPSIDIRNARVAIYPDNLDSWVLDQFVLTTTLVGNEEALRFEFTHVIPDTYYLDVWKDTNTDNEYDGGDLFGFFGTGEWPNAIVFTPIVVGEAEVVEIDTILVRLLAN